MSKAITDRFAAACSPVIGLNNPTCGSITRASIAHLTAADLDTMFLKGGLFADLDAWLKHSIEMKACGVQRFGLYDWIMANADMTKGRAAVNPGVKTMGSDSLVQPFIIGNQESVVNKDHFYVSNGWAVSAYDILNTDLATYPLTNAQLALAAGTDRVIRVQTRHSVDLDVNLFRVKDVMFLFNKHANGSSLQGNWKIVAAAVDAARTYVDLVVTSENAGSTQAYDAGPTSGYIIPGINNVNDFESFCQTRSTVDPRKKVLFWLQTSRETVCTDEMYEEVYARLMTSNAAFEQFGDLPAAKQNKQREASAQRARVNAFFFNKPLQYQTKNDWESLEAIYTIPGTILDPTGASANPQLIARRANYVGVREQLRLCDRVKDLQGNPLNLYEFLNLCYDLIRARTSQGRTVTDLDFFTNNQFKALFQTAYVAYIQAEYGGAATFPVEQGKMNEFGMLYDSYYFKFPSGVKINLISDYYFDDKLNEQSQITGHEPLGNYLLCLDIGKPSTNGGSIYLSQIASNTRSYRTADIQDLAKYDPTYRCALEVSHIRQALVSHTETVVVECPLNSLWIENFALVKPITTGKTLAGGTYSYTDLI